MTSASVATSTPPFTGYHHLGLTVSDIEASEAWYGEVLGLVRAFVEPHHDGTGYAVVMTRPGLPFYLGLDHHDNADKASFGAHRTGLDHLAFGVATRADLDAWVAQLDAHGVAHDKIVETSEPVDAAVVNFWDPDGIALELVWMGH
jgi:catechol 2,3-dioxygenase-like lactoylglutathione lyase family enzyme